MDLDTEFFQLTKKKKKKATTLMSFYTKVIEVHSCCHLGSSSFLNAQTAAQTPIKAL